MALTGGPPALRVAYLVVGLCSAACSPGPSQDVDAVVLIVLDTVRADHLSGYGYGRHTTPHLDRFAAEAECYSQAFGHAPWTLPSVASVLTGSLPHMHRANHSPNGYGTVPETVPHMAKILRAAGFRTAAFVNVVFLGPQSGLARGFDVYDARKSDATNRGQRDATATTNAAIDWLRSIDNDPFFLFVHYFDAHLTYEPPAPHDILFDREGRTVLPPTFGHVNDLKLLRDGDAVLSSRQKLTLMARYDGEIRYVDTQFGRLRAALEKAGRWDRSIVILLSDHGEEFWDHGAFEHGHSHYEELLRVLLIAKRPGREGGFVRDERVRQIDILPTVLHDVTGEVPLGLPGTALGTGPVPRAIAQGSLWAGELLSLRSSAGTLIVNRQGDQREFYLPGDAGEVEDALALRPEEAAEMEAILRALPPARSDSAEEWVPTLEQRERLRALGYVD